MGNKIVCNSEDLFKLATEVLKVYEVNPENISVIQGDSIKTVWKIKTKNELLCLKRLKQVNNKALFSVNAQIFIKDSGGNVPAIILSKNNQQIVQYNDQLFVMYEWLNGSDLDFQNQSDLAAAIEGLARFHVSSKGYVPPQEAEISTKLGKWPNQYTSMKNKLILWKEEAKNHPEPYYSSYLKHVDSMIELSNLALEALGKSSYEKLVSKGSSSIVLCHQDYGKGNALRTENGVIVIDLDGVTYDLPARDLRKIIGKYSENMGSWETSTIQNILKWYIKVNPMSDLEKEVLYIDLLFPHWFFGLVKNLFQNNKPLKTSEIEKIAQLEKLKVGLLKKLLERDV